MSFEEHLVISDHQTEYFETSLARLTLVDLLGEIGQLLQCTRTLPSLMPLKTLRLTTWEYWHMDDFLSLLANLQRIIAANKDSCRLVTLEITNYTGSGYSPVTLYNPTFVTPGFYVLVLEPLKGILGSTLSTLRLDPLIDMEFCSDFLVIFLAAKNLQYLSVGSNAARLVHPTSLITIDSVVTFIGDMPYLEHLLIPWTIETRLSEVPDAVASPASSSSSSEVNHEVNHVINPNLRSLGYPYGYGLDTEAITSVLEVLDSVLPSLTHLLIFSCYIDDWNDSLYDIGHAVNFSLESFHVVYEDDVHSHL